MTDWSHGSAYPYLIRGGAQNRDHTFTDSRASVCTDSRPSGHSHGAARKARRREWIVRTGAAPAELPMWTSRDGWCTELAGWLATDEGLAECARVHIRPELVLRVAGHKAAHADHATGRNCAVSNATVATAAGCSERTVTTVNKVLSASGLAVEAHRGTGSASTPGYGRRPSIWHLISRPRPVDKPAVCDLPPSRRDRRVSPVERKSPSTRERAREVNSSPKQTHPPRSRRRYRATPRPLAVQRLAAGLALAAHGLDRPGRAHIGALCDAIDAAGIDATAWNPKALAAALNADMRATGWSWPDRIERPGAFLASRLRRLPARPDPSGPVHGGTAAGLEQSRTGPATARPVLVAAVAECPAPEPVQTAAGRAYARQLFAEQRQHRTADVQTRQAVAAAVRHSAPPAAPETAECAMCGCTDAPRRRFLPPRRAHICDACFHGCGGEQARTGRVGTVGSSSAVPTCQ